MTKRLTDEEIADLERLERLLPPAPWRGNGVAWTWDGNNQAVSERTLHGSDVAKIRNVLGGLLAEVRASRAAPSVPSEVAEALRETARRAGLPINLSLTGVPSSPKTLADAIAECVRLAIDHVTEPIAAALRLLDGAEGP